MLSVWPDVLRLYGFTLHRVIVCETRMTPYRDDGDGVIQHDPFGVIGASEATNHCITGTVTEFWTHR